MYNSYDVALTCYPQINLISCIERASVLNWLQLQICFLVALQFKLKILSLKPILSVYQYGLGIGSFKSLIKYPISAHLLESNECRVVKCLTGPSA